LACALLGFFFSSSSPLDPLLLLRLLFFSSSSPLDPLLLLRLLFFYSW